VYVCEFVFTWQNMIGILNNWFDLIPVCCCVCCTVCCSVLQRVLRVAVMYFTGLSLILCVVPCVVLRVAVGVAVCVAVRIFQLVEACCSVLQRVATFCSVSLQLV